MGYQMRNGRWADTIDVELFDGAHAATVESAVVELGDRGTFRGTLAVTAGTGTLDVAIQTSADGVTWRAVAAFAQAAGVTSERKSFSGMDRYMRAVATIVTGPFTFSLIGEAV